MYSTPRSLPQISPGRGCGLAFLQSLQLLFLVGELRLEPRITLAGWRLSFGSPEPWLVTNPAVVDSRLALHVLLLLTGNQAVRPDRDVALLLDIAVISSLLSMEPLL